MPKRKPFLQFQAGVAQEYMILGIVILMGVVMSGLFFRGFPPPKPQEPVTPGDTQLQCCDSGNGDACQPSKDKTVSYGGVQYGLLKSNVILAEGVTHLKDSGQKSPDGKQIVISTADGFLGTTDEGCKGDAVWNGEGTCTSIANEELVYICTSNCDPFDKSRPLYGQIVNIKTGEKINLSEACNDPTFFSRPPYNTKQVITCFGNPNSTFDVYAKTGVPIPDVIRNCQANTTPSPTPEDEEDTTPTPLPQQLISPTPIPGQKNNLQLGYFIVKTAQPAPNATNWISPFCKPAIYLYPETTEQVHVSVDSKGPLTYTIPLYPEGGWNVVANPNGDISYASNKFDYLYYETHIPDSLVQEPNEGFVVSYDHIKPTLQTILPKLSLNEKETGQFVDYWTKALPKNPYYRINVLSQSNIDQMAALNITPKPQTVIRVALQFIPLDEPVTVKEPVLTPAARNGFTVVEWGGLFKKDKDHPFTCMM